MEADVFVPRVLQLTAPNAPGKAPSRLRSSPSDLPTTPSATFAPETREREGSRRSSTRRPLCLRCVDPSARQKPELSSPHVERLRGVGRGPGSPSSRRTVVAVQDGDGEGQVLCYLLQPASRPHRRGDERCRDWRGCCGLVRRFNPRVLSRLRTYIFCQGPSSTRRSPSTTRGSATSRCRHAVFPALSVAHFFLTFSASRTRDP